LIAPQEISTEAEKKRGQEKFGVMGFRIGTVLKLGAQGTSLLRGECRKEKKREDINARRDRKRSQGQRRRNVAKKKNGPFKMLEQPEGGVAQCRDSSIKEGNMGNNSG